MTLIQDKNYNILISSSFLLLTFNKPCQPLLHFLIGQFQLICIIISPLFNPDQLLLDVVQVLLQFSTSPSGSSSSQSNVLIRLIEVNFISLSSVMIVIIRTFAARIGVRVVELLIHCDDFTPVGFFIWRLLEQLK